MCHVGTKSAGPFVAPSSEPQWGLTLIETSCPYFLGSNRRSRSDGEKLSIPSTSCTPAARRGASPKTYWQVLALLSSLPRLSKLHRLTTREERGTQDWERRVHLAHKHSAIRTFGWFQVPTPEGNSISDPFRPEGYVAALRRLRPGKSPGLVSIFREFIFHAGPAPKSWFCDFLTS